MNSSPFCIKDVLKRPLFQRATLIAGERGVVREVRWVHILEITHAAPYVSKYDLILTTGLWLKRSAKSGPDYIRQLVEHGTSGLCIEFGTTIAEIPDQIITLCNACNFPLILFRKPVRFEEITQDIHTHLINRHFRFLKQLEQFSQKLQQLVLQSSDIPILLRMLHSYSGQRVVYLSALEANQFYPSPTSATANAIHRFCNGQIRDFNAIKDAEILAINPSCYLLLQPVVCFGQTFSCIGIILDHKSPDEYMKLLLDYTAKSVATVLLRTQFIEEKRLNSQNKLIQDILCGRIESEKQARKNMGLFSLKEERYLFVGGIIECVSESGSEHGKTFDQDVSVFIRSLLKRHLMQHLLMMKDHRIYFICAKAEVNEESRAALDNHVQEFVAHLKRAAEPIFKAIQFRVGIGRMQTRLLDMGKSFREAGWTLEIAQAVPEMEACYLYEKAGIYKLLKSIPETVLADFIYGEIGCLVDYDRKHHSNLADTLSMYFRCMGSKGETARQLFIHRQTLYHRLDKIRELLGDDCLTPQRRSCLEMALFGYALLYHNQTETQ